MEEKPRFATFDCYGTLVDWEGGLGTFLHSLALGEGDTDLVGSELRGRWEAIQFELLSGRYRRYKEILEDSLREWCGERGYRWNENHAEALVAAMRSWQPFPDTCPALLQARAAGLKLAILSNTDRDIIAHTLRQLGVEFDAVVTAEDCRSYKPSERNFEQLLETIDARPEEVLHVAFGFKYDIGPANALGMRSAWVNRHVEARPAGAMPDLEWRDLWGLAELAGGPGPVPDGAARSSR